MAAERPLPFIVEKVELIPNIAVGVLNTAQWNLEVEVDAVAVTLQERKQQYFSDGAENLANEVFNREKHVAMVERKSINDCLVCFYFPVGYPPYKLSERE